MNNYKKLRLAIWVFTLIVFALVIFLHSFTPVEEPSEWITLLPLINAVINGTCFLLLIAALVAIKRKNIARHRSLMTTTMIFSVLFLLVYVLHHALNGETAYLGEYKGLYYTILLTHILLAGVSLPFILLSYARAYCGMVEKHKKMVRWVYPVWLYVTLTGVLVYLFLAPYYGTSI